MAQTFDLNRNHFELFGIAPRFGIDLDALNRSYRRIQGEVHPDRFTHLPGAAQRSAMQWATHVNGAYQTLKSPQARARYLIELGGAALDERGGTGLPVAFLTEQMEWREKVEAARERQDSAELSALEQESEAEMQQCCLELERTLDRERDLDASRVGLYRLMFLDKLSAEIGDAIEAIETAT
jgi:molecular chaperone HscB